MSAFWSQGGYAFYVWTAYGLALILLIAEVLQLRHHRREVRARLGRLLRMRAREDGREE